MSVGGLESAAEVPAGSAQARFPCFDGLRAVAAVSVLITHVAYLSGFNSRSSAGAFTARLDVGVAVFFVISGFLLYRPYAAARFGGEAGPRPLGFFWRRALRIFPAYWLALTVGVFILNVPARVPDLGDLTLYYGLAHLYSLDNVVGPILSSYTLVTEIAFYLFLPVYAYALSRVRAAPEQRLACELLAVGGLFVAGSLYRAFVTLGDFAPNRSGQLLNWLPAWIDVFAVGMALAVLSVWLAQRRRGAPLGLDRPWAPAVSWALAGLTFVALSAWIGRPGADLTFYTSLEETGIHYLYLLVGVFLLLPAIFGPQDRGVIRGFLKNPIVQWVGLVSYGLYLWNETLMEKYLQWTDRAAFATPFGDMLIAVSAMSLLAAAASYYALERPVLRQKGRVPLFEQRPRTATPT